MTSISSQDQQEVEADNDDISSNSSNAQPVDAAADDDISSCDNEEDNVYAANDDDDVTSDNNSVDNVEMYYPVRPKPQPPVEMYYPARPKPQPPVDMYYPARPKPQPPVKMYNPPKVTDEDIEIMMMTVKADRGAQGNCGVNYKFAVGDTYKCMDNQAGFVTSCVVESSKLHLCCAERDGCDDLDDMKAWRF